MVLTKSNIIGTIGIWAWLKISLLLSPFVFGMANQTKMVFGSETTAISLATTLANAANTYDGLGSCTTLAVDNSADLYPYAKATLNITDTFAAAPTAGSTIDLYMVEVDIDGTIDETPIPASGDILYLAKYVGSFVLDNQDVATIKSITISLEGVKKAKFYLLNNCGQTISYSSTATTLKIQPFTYGPA